MDKFKDNERLANTICTTWCSEKFKPILKGIDDEYSKVER